MLVMRHYSMGSPLLVLSLLTGCKDGGTGPAADYTLSLTQAAPTIEQGTAGTTTVTLTRTNFTGAVTLSLGSAPAGVTGSFNPAALTGTSATLTVSVGAAVAPGVYNLTVAGTGSAGNRSTPLTLTVSAAPDYTLALTPVALTIVQGGNGRTTVTITRTNFTGAVTLSLGCAPAGVTGSFNPAAPTGTSSALTVSVGAAVAPGVYNLTVDGTGTPGNRSTPLTLTVTAAPADYTLSATPAALTIVQGGNGNTTVTITRTNFTGAVTLSLGGAPAGITGSFNPAAPTGTSSTLTVSVGTAVAPGVYNLTVDGTGTPGNRSTTFEVTCVRVDERIAFWREEDPFYARDARIHVAYADGSNDVILASGNWPAWSPDGANIVFTASDSTCSPVYCYYYIYYPVGVAVMNADGTGFQRLTGDGSDTEAAWRPPSGDKIAFTRYRDGRNVLYIMNRDGSAPSPVPLPANLIAAWDPAWSPDGATLAFTCVVDNGNADICRVNPDGTGFRRLTADAASDERPAWKPDGSAIAFTTRRYGDYEVAVMSPDGDASGVTRVSPRTAASDPAWSSDNTRIAFVGTHAGFPYVGVFVIRADGTGLSRLTSDHDHGPAWRP